MTTITIEQKLVDNATNGVWLEFEKFIDANGNNVFEAPTLEQINDDNITIDADFIRNILLGLATDKPIQGVFIRGAIIKGKLDLKDATLKGFTLPPLRLDDCLIVGNYKKDPDKKNDLFDPVIDARYCNLKRLTLKRSRIGIIDISGAKVDSTLDMDLVSPIDEKANACLKAQNAEINGNVILRSCNLKLNIASSQVYRNLGYLKDKVIEQNEIVEVENCGELEYRVALNFIQAKIRGSVCIFEKNGIEKSTFPYIDGGIDFSHATIEKNIWIQNAKIKGVASINYQSDYSSTAISAQGLQCNLFHLSKSNKQVANTNVETHNFDYKDVSIHGHIDLLNASAGWIKISDLYLAGNMVFSTAKVNHNLFLSGIRFFRFPRIQKENSKISFSDITQIDLRQAQLAKSLEVTNVECNKFIISNATIGGDSKYVDDSISSILSSNVTVSGSVNILNFPPRHLVKEDWMTQNNEYSEDYKSRLIDFDNACIGSDFEIESCFVGHIRAKNIRVKGDTKFIDTFARFNIKLANIEGNLHFDNEHLTLLSHIVMEEENHPVRKIIESGIPKITANDLEVAGAVILNCLTVNAEYIDEDAKPELDFSGGIFKSEFHIADISFRRTFKDSRPVFSLDDAVIDGDIHFEKNKQVRKQLDEFTRFFIDTRNSDAYEEHKNDFINKELKKLGLDYSYRVLGYFSRIYASLTESEKQVLLECFPQSLQKAITGNPFQVPLYAIYIFYQENFWHQERLAAIKECFKKDYKNISLINFNMYGDGKKPDLLKILEENIHEIQTILHQSNTGHIETDFISSLCEQYKEGLNNIMKKLDGYFLNYAEGWDISKFNYRYIKRYKLSCYPNHEYVELISEAEVKVDHQEKNDKQEKPNTKKRKLTTSLLIHKTDKTQSIHLNGKSELIHWLHKQDKDHLQLNTQEQALDYLKFFCAHLHGDNKPFWVVIKNSELNEYLYPPELLSNINKLTIFRRLTPWPSEIHRVTIEKELDYWKIEKVPIMFANMFFLANFAIKPNGDVNMINDDPIAEFPNFKNLKYESPTCAIYNEDKPDKPYSIARYYSWKEILFFPKLAHTRYVLLHLMHVNFRMSGLSSAAFKFDMNGTKHNFGCGINLQLDGFEYKRVEDNDEMLKGALISDNGFTSSGSTSDKTKRKISTDHLDKDKYDGIEGVLDKQYDNPKIPTHTGFDSQPYEQMAKVLSSAGAYSAAKRIVLKRIKHESIARNWLIKTQRRVKGAQFKKPHAISMLLVTSALLWLFSDRLRSYIQLARAAFNPAYLWIAIGIGILLLLVIYAPPYVKDISTYVEGQYAKFYDWLEVDPWVKKFVKLFPEPPNEFKKSKDKQSR